jgi:hypothetical protein
VWRFRDSSQESMLLILHANRNGIGWARTSGIVRARTLGENI